MTVTEPPTRARPAGGPGRIFSRGPRSAYASRQFLQIALPIAFDSPVRTVPGTSRGRGRSVNSLRLGVPLPPPAASACLLDIVYRSDYSPRSAPLRAETPLRVRVITRLKRAAACGVGRAACPYVRALNDGRNPSVSTATDGTPVFTLGANVLVRLVTIARIRRARAIPTFPSTYKLAMNAANKVVQL